MVDTEPLGPFGDMSVGDVDVGVEVDFFLGAVSFLEYFREAFPARGRGHCSQPENLSLIGLSLVHLPSFKVALCCLLFRRLLLFQEVFEEGNKVAVDFIIRSRT